MIIAVTGGAGFLGRHVARTLIRAGHQVRALDIRLPVAGDAPAETSFPIIEADLTDPAAARSGIAGVDAVVHAAGVPRPDGRPPDDIFTTNVTATFAVVQAATDLGVKHLVYASSISVLGYPFFERPITPPYLPIDEQVPPAPQDAYALSKLVGEQIIDAAIRRTGLIAVSVRMPWLQSPGTFARDMSIARHTDAAVRNLWCYLDVRDAARGIEQALMHPHPGHLRLFLSAHDTFMPQPTLELIRTHFPRTTIRRPFSGNASLIDTSQARDLIGFQPGYSWRDYPAVTEKTADSA
jgi:nucleoside-diphosphate-sugar epimerase